MKPEKIKIKEHKNRNCLFCRWKRVLNREEEDEKLKGELEKRKIDEDEHWFAILDKSPKTLGHTLVISKYPFDDIIDEKEDPNSVEIKKNLFEGCLKVAEKLTDVFPDEKDKKIYLVTMCDHYEIWETRDGNTTEHLHFHLIPRYPTSTKGEKLICKEGKVCVIGDLKRVAELIRSS